MFTKLIDYLFYNVIDQIFISKVRIEWKNNKNKMNIKYVSWQNQFVDKNLKKYSKNGRKKIKENLYLALR